MKYRIEYRECDVDDDQGGIVEFLSAVEVEYFKIKNGFVAVWFEDDKTQIPNLYINANDVLTIERVD